MEEKFEENQDGNIGPQSTEAHEFNPPKGIKVYSNLGLDESKRRQAMQLLKETKNILKSSMSSLADGSSHLGLDESTRRQAIQLLKETKNILKSIVSSLAGGSPEEMERFWSACVLYCVSSLGKAGKSKEDGVVSLCQILRESKLNIVDFFKEMPQFCIKVAHVLTGLYGSDWEKRLELKELQADIVHLSLLSRFKELVSSANVLISVLAVLIIHIPVRLRNFNIKDSSYFEGLTVFKDFLDGNSLKSNLIILEKEYENVINTKGELDERMFSNDEDILLGSGSLSGGAINLPGTKRKYDVMASPAKSITSPTPMSLPRFCLSPKGNSFCNSKMDPITPGYYNRTICTGSGERFMEEEFEENEDGNIGPQSTEVHEFNPPKGIKVYNMVEWSLDGSVNDVLESFRKAIGHQRLWCFENGKHMDVSELLKQLCARGLYKQPDTGEDVKVVYTTPEKGTFYLKVTYQGDSILFPIHGREYWLDGFGNGNGFYEFDRSAPATSNRNPVILEKPGPFLDNLPGWSLLQGCHGDYSNQNGLCPHNLGSVEMGLRSLRNGFKSLRDYRGALPVPEAVRIGCARFVIYGPEAVKLNEMFQLDCDTLEETECESPEIEGIQELADGSKLTGGRKLEDVNICAPPLIRKWNALSKERLQYIVKLIISGKYTSDIKEFPATGIQGIDGTLNAINVTPYNLTLPREVCKRRTEKADPIDEGADGRPHPLSKKFACMWPYDGKIARLTPKSRIITAADISWYSRDRRLFSTVSKLSRVARRLPK